MHSCLKFVHGTIFKVVVLIIKSMSGNQNHSEKNREEKLPAAETGNASNPSPHDEKMEPAHNNQLLNEGAEKYLRESASIEDYPDPEDQSNADEIIRKENTNR
jgi:hypothetical protein